MRTEIRRVEFPQFVVRECVYPAGLHLPRHAHDYSNVTIVVGGDMEESAAAGEHRGHAFSVVTKPAGSEHENRVGRAGTRTLAVELRRPVGGRWSWFEEPEVVRAAVSLVRAWRAGGNLEASAFALLAEVMSDGCAGGAAPPWLQEVTRMLDARFDEPLRFDAMAREIGLHPVYLSRAFQRYTGRTMQQYLCALRLRHARHLLSASSRTITAIAADAGFADSSHLCRTFANLLDITPGGYRGLARTSDRVLER
jgi:AraC family transcriptional regulator